jgi:hypothetical protein
MRQRSIRKNALALTGGSASRPPGFSAIMPSQAVQIKTGGTAAKAASRPGLAPESALRLHPCRALSSAPVRISVGEECCFAKLVVVAGGALTHNFCYPTRPVAS